MHGKNPHLSALESRKQLLIVESEINRACLNGEIAVLQADVQALHDRAGSLGSIVASATTLTIGLMSVWNTKPDKNTPKYPWLQNIFKGTGLLSSLWKMFRPEE